MSQRFSQLQDWELCLLATAVQEKLTDRSEKLREEIMQTLRDRKASHS